MARSHLHALIFALCVASALGALCVNYDRGPEPLGRPANLSWSIDENEKTISMGLEIFDSMLRTTGSAWVGIGVGEETSGSMLGADIYTAEFSKDILDNCSTKSRNVPFASFPLTESGVFPEEDACQNSGSWTLVNCERDADKGTVTFEVKRPMNATTSQDRALGPDTQSIMYAYGGESFKYHKANRGTSRISLYKADFSYPTKSDLELPSDLNSTFTILATEYKVPPKTTYACTSKRIPIPKGEKRYVVAAKNIIESKSGADKTHHTLLYACPDTPYARLFANTTDCSQMGPGNPNNGGCNTLVHAWAVGAPPTRLPADVGILIDETNNYVIMETHYDNPDDATDAVDISGAQFFMAKERKIEAGLLMLGDSGLSLRNRRIETGLNYTSTCPSSCTSKWPEQEINVIASFQHMHRTGQKIYTNRFNSTGDFVETVNAVEFWSNDHQVGKYFNPPKKITRGDTLSTTCIYNTTLRPNTTFGLRTEDEMCIDFIMYYPAQKVRANSSQLFPCGMFGLPLRNNSLFFGTVCGEYDNQGFSFVSNPSFNDTVGFRTSFGEEPSTCPQLKAASDSDTTTKDNSTESACFPSDALVYARSRGLVRMDDLNVGDEVAIGDGRYSSVFMFTHRVSEGTYDFVELITDAGSRIRLTNGHMLYANDNLVRADSIVTGDNLVGADGKLQHVVQVSRVVARGLYNPQTEHGDIVVDGIRASTYTYAVAPQAAHAFLALLRALRKYIGMTYRMFEDNSYTIVRAFRHMRTIG